MRVDTDGQRGLLGLTVSPNGRIFVSYTDTTFELVVLWVVDNEPRDGDERVARGDQRLDPEVALALPADSAPSGLAATGDSLYVCSYNDLELNRFDLIDGVVTFVETVAGDCLLDVELLANGDLVYSTGSTIVRLTP